MIIGAQKAATTSLHVYLGEHPQIQMSEPKELNFFAGPGWKNSERGIEWYESHFSSDHEIRGESSPSYAAFPIVPGVPERISALIPDCKLIYLVRDPVERMISQYVHVYAGGHEHRDLAQVVTASDFAEGGYVMKSRYAFQLSRYLGHFPRSQILILSQEEFLRDGRTTLESALRFLGVDDKWRPKGLGLLYNTSDQRRRQRWLARRYSPVAAATRRRGPVGKAARRLLSRPVPRPAVDPATRARLEDLVRDDVQALRELTGKPFAEWSV